MAGKSQAKEKSQGVQETREHDKEKKWMHSMEIMLGSIDNRRVEACSIPIIPQKLRKSKEDAYRPKLVSIGPVHRGRTELLYMEEPKWRCMLHLLRRTEDEITSLENLISKPILRLDEVVRACYASEIKFDSYNLAKIMLLDGCFILELVISSSEGMPTNLPCTFGNHPDGPGIKLGKEETILSDLLVLENQVPFFILERLFGCLFLTSKDGQSGSTEKNDGKSEPTEKEDGKIELIKMMLSLFGCHSDLFDSKASHLLQLVHSSITRHSSRAENESQQPTARARVKLKRCASELHAAGIQIIASQCSDCGPLNSSTNGKIAQRFHFGIKFEKRTGILEIPQLHITKTTEAEWRNFIAWEQSRSDWRNTLDWEPSKNGQNCKFTSYALFFKGLICCVHDVVLLKEKKIIVVDPKTSNEELVDMFHKITEEVDHMDSCYTADCKKLNKYSKTNRLKKWSLIQRHHFRRTVTSIIFLCRNLYKVLIRDHMPTVWKTLGVVAAVVLLFLTIAQTVLAALSL